MVHKWKTNQPKLITVHYLKTENKDMKEKKRIKSKWIRASISFW